MFTLKHLFLVTLLISASFAKINVRNGLPDFQLLKEDVADFDLKNVFDFSQVKGTVSFDTNVGRTFSKGQPFAMKTLDSYGVTKANNIKAHDNWVAAVYDDTTLVFQTIDTDGKKFASTQVVSLKKFGANLCCTGTAYNPRRNYMYIGCFDKTSTEASPGAMYVFTYDFQSNEIIGEVSVKQDDGFRIVNELVLFIENFP
jgi:hypothetical protein